MQIKIKNVFVDYIQKELNKNQFIVVFDLHFTHKSQYTKISIISF